MPEVQPCITSTFFASLTCYPVVSVRGPSHLLAAGYVAANISISSFRYSHMYAMYSHMVIIMIVMRLRMRMRVGIRMI